MALSPDSFAPEALSLASLLNELNGITSEWSSPLRLLIGTATNSIVRCLQVLTKYYALILEAISVGNNIGYH
ncbi:hypothetical protein O9929_20595 [Vibrio lentus]|nr:hypothetical protein [Vibrio lentus]